MSQEHKLRYTRSERKAIVLLLSMVLIFNLIGRVVQQHTMLSDCTPSFSLKTKQDVPRLQKKIQKKKTRLELNGADSLKLLKLVGIGPVFSSRIIKYRNLLGGFYRKEQLLEVYGLDSARYLEVESQVRVDSLKVKKIYLGIIDFRGLLRHPYLDYNQVKSFIAFRDRNGPPDSFQDIMKAQVWPDSTFLRIRPYLSCGESRKK